MESHTAYHESLALIIISSISIGLGAIAALYIAIDILVRRGWRSMMGVMIPVYIINALYLWPLTFWTYLNYGRPKKPSPKKKITHDDESSSPSPSRSEKDISQDVSPADGGGGGGGGGGHCCHNSDNGPQRPMFATVTVAVCHCGAGCVLGDVIGEWLVYGTGVTINGEMLWAAYLADFAFAIAIGIVFQYYSIAPMSGDYGVKTLWRAAKADFLSLLFFEVGLFAWMAVFQIAIFDYRLGMNTVTYWWMMQIGMSLGHWTGMPINWYLIRTGVKEPCA